MRKLLIASQKGGVGKTTTSINLAAAAALAGTRVLLVDADPLSSISSSLLLHQYPNRQSLRQAGVALPGVLTCNIVPGLDVLSPYEEGSCSDEELDALFALLRTPALEEFYGCLLVDTPPFLGTKPGQLLCTCEEFLLVMRAEPLAARTLPAFLELVQRARGQHTIRMRGIVLTLPEGEQLGGRWERELRGRYGTRIIPEVIPFDEAVSQAIDEGQIVCHSQKQSPVAEAFHKMVEPLQLHGKGLPIHEKASSASAFLQAFQSIDSVGSIRKKSTRASRKVAVTVPPAEEEVAYSQPSKPAKPQERPARQSVSQPTGKRFTPSVPPPVDSGSPVSPSKNLDRQATELPKPVVVRRQMPSPKPRALVVPPPVSPPMETPTQVVPAAPSSRQPFPLWGGLVLGGLAVASGVGLRFVPLQEDMIPFLVGFGVFGVTVLLFTQLSSAKAPAASPPPTPRPVAKKAKESNATLRRLKGLKRQLTTERSTDPEAK